MFINLAWRITDVKMCNPIQALEEESFWLNVIAVYIFIWILLQKRYVSSRTTITYEENRHSLEQAYFLNRQELWSQHVILSLIWYSRININNLPEYVESWTGLSGITNFSYRTCSYVMLIRNVIKCHFLRYRYRLILH